MMMMMKVVVVRRLWEQTPMAALLQLLGGYRSSAATLSANPGVNQRTRD